MMINLFDDGQTLFSSQSCAKWVCVFFRMLIFPLILLQAFRGVFWEKVNSSSSFNKIGRVS